MLQSVLALVALQFRWIHWYYTTKSSNNSSSSEAFVGFEKVFGVGELFSEGWKRRLAVLLKWRPSWMDCRAGGVFVWIVVTGGESKGWGSAELAEGKTRRMVVTTGCLWRTWSATSTNSIGKTASGTPNLLGMCLPELLRLASLKVERRGELVVFEKLQDLSCIQDCDKLSKENRASSALSAVI
jgi:hypothetical protein